MKNPLTQKQTLAIFIATLIASSLFRILPHLPNFNPEISLCLMLAGLFPKRTAIISILALAIISDGIGSAISGYPVFGIWTWFTYSGFVGLLLLRLNSTWHPKKYSFVLMSILANGGFWLWTNFGVWLTSGIYPKTAAGLTQCYILAWPFLGTALLSGLIWGTVIVLFTNLASAQLICKLAKLP